jgi:hypothetical protein
MAYNPFAWFRKRQKVFLAGLAIFCMFMFVLSFGQGDAIQYFLGLIGARTSGDKTEVTKLYEKKVTVGELGQLAYDRQVAQDFILAAQAQGKKTFLEKEIPSVYKEVDQLSSKSLENIVLMAQFPQFFTGAQGREQILKDLQTVARIHQSLVLKGKADEAKLLEKLTRVLETNLWMVTAQDESYFGGSFQTDNLLDFLVWKHQADQLGVVLTPDDVAKEINREAFADVFEGDKAKDEAKLREIFGQQRYRTVTLDDLLRILGDEFRVRLAHEALTGTQPGVRAFQATGLAGGDTASSLTPDQFWEAYKENRTEVRAALLAVPVKDFVGKVTGTPKEEVLRRLYNQYSEVEPAPSRDKPGFKEPRRVKVEWVSASADGPYYQKKSAEAAQLADAVRPLAFIGTPELPLGLPVPAMVQLRLTLFDLREAAEYDVYLRGVHDWLDDVRQFDGSRPSETGLGRPENAAAVVADVMGVAGTQGTLLSVAVSLQGSSSARQADLSLRGAGAVAAGFEPTPFGVVTQLGALFTRPVQPAADARDPLAEQHRRSWSRADLVVHPAPAIRDLLTERGLRRYGTDLVFGTLLEFRKELDKRAAKDAAAYVAEHARPDKGFTRHEVMERAADQHEIGDVPTLEALKAAHNKNIFFMGDRLPPFATLFFNETGTYKPQVVMGDDPYLYWKTEDKKAYVPSFDEARPKVEAAWRFEEARKLAMEEAKRIAEAVKEPKEGTTAERTLRDLGYEKGYRVFEPAGAVAKLVEAPRGLALGNTEYEPYRFAESQIAYPRPDTVDRLLKLQKGEVTIVPDRPEKEYLVAVLLGREEPTLEKFHKVYEQTGNPFLRDVLWSRLSRERQQRFAADLLKQLRAEAAPVDDNGNYKVDPEVRKKVDRRERGEDEG